MFLRGINYIMLLLPMSTISLHIVLRAFESRSLTFCMNSWPLSTRFIYLCVMSFPVFVFLPYSFLFIYMICYLIIQVGQADVISPV